MLLAQKFFSSVASQMRRSLVFALASLLIVAALPGRAKAYEGDHYVWTYYIALQLGYSKRQAYQIADATYAIDWDKDTGPMEATAGDALFGANHTAFVGTKHPQIATIWSRFHAFKQEMGQFVGPGDQMNIRRRMLDDLWKLALIERNPGPYIHLLQDSYAHRDFDTTRGHAFAGHLPDFMGYDEEKAKGMTRDTITALSDFMRLVLKKEPKPVNMTHIYAVLNDLMKANPVPSAVSPLTYNPYGGSGVPSLGRSLDVVNRAIENDEAAKRLPKFSESAVVSFLPAKWYQYDYGTNGSVSDPLYAIEKPDFEVDKEVVLEVTPINENNFKIKVRLPYKLSGLLDLKDGRGSPFLSPLPVYEKFELSDTPANPRTNSTDRKNGDYAVEFEFQRSRSELEKGVTWIGMIDAFGFEPVTRQVKIPIPAESAAAKGCKALLAQAQQFLTAGDARQAARLFAQAKQKCGGMSQSITDLLDKTEKDLDKEEQEIADEAQQSMGKCEYEDALRRAEALRAIDPNSQWLVDNFEQIRLQAEGQKKAREFLRPGLEAIQKKDLDGAISSLNQARGVTAVPQCLLDQINKLLKELELRKEFIAKTKEVEKATVDCDYKEAVRLIGEIARITPREQYIADWLDPNIKIVSDLQTRERKALDLIRQADAIAAQAETAAGTEPVDFNKVAAMGQQAMTLLTDADKEAPKCMKRQQMEQIRQRLNNLSQRKKPEIAASIVLLIDTSGSMGDNNKMFQAKQAAQRAARQASKTTEIAILNFDGGCGPGAMRVAAPFTTDVNVLLAAIGGLQPGGSTPMYIATAEAVKYAQNNGRGKARNLILMSDGGDTCRDQQAQAGAAIRSSNIPVSTIGFDIGNNAQAQGDLGNLATMTGGRTFSASAADPREIVRAFNLAMLPSLLKDIDFGSSGGAISGYFSQAKSMVQQQNISGALMMLQQANQLAPNSPNLNFNLSLLYEAEDQLIPAMNHANNYLKLAPNAIDSSDVRNRIGEIQQELARNPRVVMDSSGCRDILTWAQAERDVARRSGNATRTQAILEITIVSQRGECEKARQLTNDYKGRYR